jgi:hypothetical protein
MACVKERGGEGRGRGREARTGGPRSEREDRHCSSEEDAGLTTSDEKGDRSSDAHNGPKEMYI